jgi:RNA polymerase sigma-70 factor (ECF subfamily)
MMPWKELGARTLSDTFLHALQEPVRTMLAAEPDLESWLSTALQVARDTWPDVDLPSATYLHHLAVRVGGLKDPALHRRLHASDLYLACACLERQPRAIARFDECYGQQIVRAVERVGMDRSVADDVAADVREKLLFASDPRLAEYSGRGRLGSWVRAVARNAAVNVRLVARRHVELDEALDGADVRIDPELCYLKTLYASEFRTSLARAFDAFSRRERTLLRQYYLDGLTVAQLGRLYGVHRATAAEWVSKTRQALVRAVRHDLAARLSLSAHDLESLLRMVRSDLSINVAEFLRSAG